MNVISVLSGHFDDRRRGNAGQSGEERKRYWRAENCRSKGEGGGGLLRDSHSEACINHVSSDHIGQEASCVDLQDALGAHTQQKLAAFNEINVCNVFYLRIETLNFMETGEMKFASCIFWLCVTVEKLFISYLYIVKDMIVATWLLSGAWLISGWTFIGVPGVRRWGGWLVKKPHNSMNHIQSHICHLRSSLEFRKQIYL